MTWPLLAEVFNWPSAHLHTMQLCVFVFFCTRPLAAFVCCEQSLSSFF